LGEYYKLTEHIPNTLRDKKDYIVDSYRFFEKHNYRILIENCEAILVKIPNNLEFKSIKELCIVRLQQLDENYPIYRVELKEQFELIDNAFFRLELLMSGKVSEYKFFGFHDAFVVLFYEMLESENYTIQNCNRMNKYYCLLSQISYDHDKSEFDNQDAYNNEDFNRDCEEIDYLCWDLVEYFAHFDNSEEEKKISIKEIANIPIIVEDIKPIKSELLFPELMKYRFCDLEKVQALSKDSQSKLVDVISKNSIPYQIAMINYLGFIDYLMSEFFKTKTQLHIELAKLLSTDNRSISGNLSVLNPKSNEDRKRYTAHIYNETVKKDYESIKLGVPL